MNRDDPFPTKVAIAKYCGVSERTVHTWSNKLGWPAVPTPAAIDAFMGDMRRSVSAGSESAADIAVTELKEALTRAELAKLLEEIRFKRLKNDLTEGQLVDRDECQRAWAEAVYEAKARIESIPDELEMMFPAELRATLKLEVRDKIHMILKQLAGTEPV